MLPPKKKKTKTYQYFKKEKKFLMSNWCGTSTPAPVYADGNVRMARLFRYTAFNSAP